MISGDLEKDITPSKENYLKALLELSAGQEIRSSEIAEFMGVSKASVSNMMNRLRDEGYIDKRRYGTVTMTPKGYEEAEKIARRFNLLKLFLIQTLGVDTKTASEDACRIEHIISSESMCKIDKHLSRCLSNIDIHT